LLHPECNSFKTSRKGYDETLYPLDHAHAGQIRDFSLFNHFVKPMPAGVLVTCVMDCCHSGAVLELPYSFQPTPEGTIRMRQSMDSLSNFAFLYCLSGGSLPFGFENVASNIEAVTGGFIQDFQGAGRDEYMQDGVAVQDMQGGGEEYQPDGYYEVADESDGVDYGGVTDRSADYFGADAGNDRGFGDTGGGGWDGADMGGGMCDNVDAGDTDTDCSCAADILSALLDQ
jgi:hypothetical protein